MLEISALVICLQSWFVRTIFRRKTMTENNNKTVISNSETIIFTPVLFMHFCIIFYAPLFSPVCRNLNVLDNVFARIDSSAPQSVHFDHARLSVCRHQHLCASDGFPDITLVTVPHPARRRRSLPSCGSRNLAAPRRPRRQSGGDGGAVCSAEVCWVRARRPGRSLRRCNTGRTAAMAPPVDRPAVPCRSTRCSAAWLTGGDGAVDGGGCHPLSPEGSRGVDKSSRVRFGDGMVFPICCSNRH